MRFALLKRGIFAVSSLVGAFSCSGKNLNEVGDLSSSAGQSGSSLAGGHSSGGAIEVAGNLGQDSGGGRIANGGSAGTSGYGGGGLGLPLQAGEGGEAGQPEEGCANCTLVVAGQDIRGADANDQKIYWTDYGTKDKLGNYEGNGRVLARNLDGGATTVLADSLAGPETVALSADYAYVAVDQRDEPDLPSGVLRVPLIGGAPESLQGLPLLGYAPSMFVATTDYEYWSTFSETPNSAVFRVAQTAGAQVETVMKGELGPIFADDTQLYFFSPLSPGNTFAGGTGIWKMPLSGGSPTKVANYPGGLLQLQGDYFYGIEHVDGGGTYLTRIPKTGGSWKRIADAHNGTTWTHIAVDGDHYLVDEQTDTLRWIFRSTLADPNTTLDWEDEAARTLPWPGWVVTRVGIFFANAAGLQLTPTTAP